MNAEKIDTTYPLRGKDLTGERFGRWQVIRYVGMKKHAGRHQRWMWECHCDCGTVKTHQADNLRFGRTRSCGCEMAEISSRVHKTHGGSNTRIYRVWSMMRDRCSNPNNSGWKNYGGRGIKVCERWHDYALFYADVGHKLARGLTIERKDNDGNYEPDNVRLATQREQCQNYRRNVQLTLDGVSMNATQWATKLGIKPHTLLRRIQNGWETRRALTQPVR